MPSAEQVGLTEGRREGLAKSGKAQTEGLSRKRMLGYQGLRPSEQLNLQGGFEAADVFNLSLACLRSSCSPRLRVKSERFDPGTTKPAPPVKQWFRGI